MQTCWGVVLVMGLVCAIVLFPKVPFSALFELPPVQKTITFVCLAYFDVVGGPGAPEYGERMIREAKDDLLQRYKAGELASHIDKEMRLCIDERIVRHKLAERYDAQKCFIEWRTVQLDLMRGGGKGVIFKQPEEWWNIIAPSSFLADILLFDNKRERLWATAYAPQKIT
ncbi:hypothetical protein GS535_09735 [Saccharibacter sp. EH611]|uniref:hypothetical protein n=1 Tax=unclassified Saccharibacter TaxID=2648722 RepID=UPI0013262E24|nr:MULTISPECIES: hypothetical protein [unclassified Saccharibacter]MXV36818.1 hypothetical protein [Saccharibacter sp. EH611]MXV58692.1 hypothetical protein [Saccharibacter sp. EH70]